MTISRAHVHPSLIDTRCFVSLLDLFFFLRRLALLMHLALHMLIASTNETVGGYCLWIAHSEFDGFA